MSVAVLGAGAFGTALAISLAASRDVVLWSRSAGQVRRMRRERQNALRLPGQVFPDRMQVTADFAEAAQHPTLLVAVPMQNLRDLLTGQARFLGARTLVACCKGIEIDSGLGPVAVISQVLRDAVPALLTGPSFAADIARGLPTALTLACADDGRARALQMLLTTESLRLYRTTDTIGAELGGALKNVMAIASGVVIGAGLGDSARAALMTRGYAEMQRMALALGARPETLAGLSGFGDLALTCMSEQSRNFRLGLALGRQQDFDASVTVEGAATAHAVAAMSERLTLDMPITLCVQALLRQRLTPGEAMEQLLARPLRAE